MNNKYLSRKFMLALLFGGTGCVGLMIDKLTGTDFVLLATSLVGFFNLTDAYIKNSINKNSA